MGVRRAREYYKLKEKKMNKNNNKYDDLFDQIDVLDYGSKYIYEEMTTEYRATFYDKHLKDYDGFYYDACNVAPFKNVSTADPGCAFIFDSVQEIIDILPDAINYHKDTTTILIERSVAFVDENDETILYLNVGSRTIEI